MKLNWMGLNWFAFNWMDFNDLWWTEQNWIEIYHIELTFASAVLDSSSFYKLLLERHPVLKCLNISKQKWEQMMKPKTMVEEESYTWNILDSDKFWNVVLFTQDKKE